MIDFKKIRVSLPKNFQHNEQRYGKGWVHIQVRVL